MTYQNIRQIIETFYGRATTDFLIGYQFNRIEDFATHIPRIADFWEPQVLGTCTHPESFPFRLLAKHLPMNLKMGELNRWILLFFETLDEYEKVHPEDRSVILLWKEKVLVIKEKFLSHPSMFIKGQ